MSFWRKELIDFALGRETQNHIAEQREWIVREPQNPAPYRNLAQLYRMEGRPEEALGLLLEAVRLDPAFARAHADLAELYAVQGDLAAAWRHADLAEQHGEPRAANLLRRYNVR